MKTTSPIFFTPFELAEAFDIRGTLSTNTYRLTTATSILLSDFLATATCTIFTRQCEFLRARINEGKNSNRIDSNRLFFYEST